MRDYAQGYRSKVHSKVHSHVASRQYGGRTAAQPLRALFWKTAGTVLVVCMCTGIMASFWIGQQIQNSLSSIASLQQVALHEQNVHNVLIAEREGMLAPKRLQARAAVQNGLYAAVNNQQVDL